MIRRSYLQNKVSECGRKGEERIEGERGRGGTG